ncbi:MULTISPECIES: hypothetical protein [Agrobacterium tumefaciens complex]|uniref:NERD domain-containing protein n=1 Tax=Agrobacterium tomkonis CFBP 6623 TaxID=1183432 RepID=A0A1S7PEW1_9HYPH|nr:MULTISPECIES: hypothetical protein [Agrobacterium tumefaciens complex]QCL88751.1 hypothetical protein CFBP6623_06115 [Agrobacterium tumefaciens]CUX20083.1 conserved hypothetical protein [Agrobacterium tomkonis CFBP 6623]
MTRSFDEQEIRNAVVCRLRQLMPGARIVHELNVAGQGTNRIDVAAVGTEHIVAVEIKSRKDVLKRLEEQWKAFNEVAHFVIVAAHEKHFADYRETYWRDDMPSQRSLNHPLFFGKWLGREKVWRYPKPEHVPHPSGLPQCDGDRWFFDRHELHQRIPRATSMLEMLWAAELQAECRRHLISCSQRSTRAVMIRDLAWNLSGKEVTHAVCRQLRQRAFAEADAPIYPDQPAAASQPAQEPLSLPFEGTTA